MPSQQPVPTAKHKSGHLEPSSPTDPLVKCCQPTELIPLMIYRTLRNGHQGLYVTMFQGGLLCRVGYIDL